MILTIIQNMRPNNNFFKWMRTPPKIVLNKYMQLIKPQNKLTWQCWTRVRDNGWIPISLILTNAAEGFLLTWVFCPIWHNFSTPRAQSLPDPKHAIVQTVMNLRSPIMLSGAESAARYEQCFHYGGKSPCKRKQISLFIPLLL